MNFRLRTLMAIGSTVSVGATLIASIPAHASAELDQSAGFAGNNFSFGLSGNTQLAQTFTAGMSGELTSVGVGIAKNGTVTDLTIEIASVSGGLPSGTPLSSTTLSGSDLSVISTGQQVFTVDFASPAQVGQGTAYAIVASTTGGGSFTWYDSTFYGAGQAAINNNGSGWALDGSNPPRSLTFATYVTVPSPSSVRSSESLPASFVLTLALPAGVQCTTSTLTTSGPWIALPGAGDCIPPATQHDASLLGWATTPDFPVAIAQRQVDNGWGAYETFSDDGQLTGVFIPAGGYTTVSNDTNLFPIWSE